MTISCNVKKSTQYLMASSHSGHICTSWYWRTAAMKHGLSPLMSSSPRCWIATREYHRVQVWFTLATNPTTEFDFWVPSWYVSTPHTIRPLCTSTQISTLQCLPLPLLQIYTKHQETFLKLHKCLWHYYYRYYNLFKATTLTTSKNEPKPKKCCILPTQCPTTVTGDEVCTIK